MYYLITRWLLVTLSLLISAWLIPGVVVDSLYIALVTSLLLGLVNMIIRPVLVILTIPITILSLGFFVLVINALLFWFVASFVDGFKVSGFLSAFAGALVVSVVSYIGNRLIVQSYTRNQNSRSVIE